MGLNLLDETRLIAALASANEQFAEFCGVLRTRQESLCVKHEMSARSYQGEILIEFYVDVELKSGKNVGWWMEIHCGEAKWTIESSVLISDGSGEEKLREFPLRMAANLDEFVYEIKEATVAIRESASYYNLAL